MFEVKNHNTQYTDVVVARRNVDCSSLTANEFVKMIVSDMSEAVNSFNENALPHIKEYRIKRNTDYYNGLREKRIAGEKEYAERKWKTEKRRQDYYDTVVAFELAQMERRYIGDNVINDSDKLSFFDFDGNCGTKMSIACACSLSVKDVIDNENAAHILIRCFNALKESKYFDKAIGWEFVYNADESWQSSGRPKIALIFDENTTKEIKNGQNELNGAVREFYAHSTYFGD